MDESVQGIQEHDILQDFISCFYVDDFNQLDIAWDKYVPFATLYRQLFSATSLLLNQQIQYKPDQATLLMLWCVLVGRYSDTIHWTVDPVGKCIIEKIVLPDNIGKITANIDGLLHGERTIDADYFAKVYPSRISKIRAWCYLTFDGPTGELTHLHNVINKLIWHVSQITFR